MNKKAKILVGLVTLGTGIISVIIYKKIKEILQADPKEIEDTEYKESNLEGIDDIDSALTDDTEINKERKQMQDALIQTKRFRVNYIKNLDDDTLIKLYNFIVD